ncbi:MAG TPA: serine/threonine-protein kinase, partial [Phycisphaerae bacterium]|nr:serine/threonine-protein kinase [Phycisphaerae bacterium]
DFVNRACADEGALRTEVFSLLAHDEVPADLDRAVVDSAREVLSSATHTADSPSGADAGMPARIGAYSIIRRIGEGGMGEVFEAEQESPKRRVALKVIRAGSLAPMLVRRFEQEALVLGRLQHPGIAHIYESGMVPINGRRQPFFAMEFIAGERITTYAEKHGLSVRPRLELIARVCDAVQHAHQKGIIHRDLKPANILVVAQERGTGTRGLSGSTAIDPLGQPKILDFGIARVTDGDVQAATMQTDLGQLVGTLAYMSPEQVAGDSSRLDTRCDVYALGVVLFQLLTSRLPLDIGGRSIADAARMIRDDDPLSAAGVVRALRGDVDTIIAKALAKSPDERYESAAQLAADIRRYLSDEPIVARPASALYNVRKFARRHRGLVGGLLATFVVLLLGIAGTALGLASALQANRKLAQTNVELSTTNQKLEETNTDLTKVSDFQSSELTGIDVPLMGQRVRAALLDAAPTDQRSELAARLGAVNFVDVARKTLKENFFGRAIASVDAQFADQPVLQARLLQDLASTMRKLGLQQAAAEPQGRALAIRRRELGNTATDTAVSINEAGTLKQDLGDLDGAEALFREALAVSQNNLGNDSRQTLTLLGNVSGVLRLQGKLEEAEQLARDAVQRLQKIAGPDDHETIDALVTLGAVLRDEGKYADAEQYFREALAARRRVFGNDDLTTLMAISDLSGVLEYLAQYDEAATLTHEAYQTKLRTLGKDHPSTISSMMQVATQLSRQGKYARAEELLRDALARRRRLLGDDHPDTINTVEQLASVVSDMGKSKESEDLFRECLDRRRRVLGADHPATLRAMGNLGYILQQQGRSDEAEPYYREALAGLRRVYGDDHPHTLTAVGNLAVLLSGMGKDEEAEPLYRESLEGRRRLLGDDNPSTLNAIYNMGDMLLRSGKPTEAETYCRQALDGYRRIGGDDHIGTLYSLTLMGRLLLAENKPADAQPFLQEAVDRRRRINGDEHPQTITAIEGLAAALEEQGLWSDAEPWRRLVRKTCADSEDGDPLKAAGAQCALGRNLLRQGKNAEAAGVLAPGLAAYASSDAADAWVRWNAASLLGEALAADPARNADAEKLLHEAMDWMTAHADADPKSYQRVDEIRACLARLSTVQDKSAEAVREHATTSAGE